MSTTVPKLGYLDSAYQIFIRNEAQTYELEGRTPEMPILGKLFWVSLPEVYLVFTGLQRDIEQALVVDRLLREDLPLVMLSSESGSEGKIAHFGKGDEANAAKAATLIHIVCGWAEAEFFEMISATKKYQVDARLERDQMRWIAWIVSEASL